MVECELCREILQELSLRGVCQHVCMGVQRHQGRGWGMGLGRVEWCGVVWSGVEWSGVEWSGVEWSGLG